MAYLEQGSQKREALHVKRCVVTGAGGQIAYSLLFKIAAGDLFGQTVGIELVLFDLEESMPVLKGIQMELQDCAFPLLKKLIVTSRIDEAFANGDCYFLIGAKPRSPGMERRDLLQENAKIFQVQGQALAHHAKKDARVLIVGNPCNTNCLLAMSWVPHLPRRNFAAMMRLDQNRLQAMIAEKAGVAVDEVAQVFIWGNHSSTQVVGLGKATIQNRSISTYSWFNPLWQYQELQPRVQKRGAEVLAMRGKSSAASAAHAACQAMKALYAEDAAFSAAVWSEGNPYEVRGDLVFSFPCRRVEGKKDCLEILNDHSVDEMMHRYLAITENELIDEREQVKHLMGSN